MENKTLALFDFDGTVTHKDTFIEFIKFTHSPFRFWFGMWLYSPVLVLYKLKIIPNDQAKMQIFNYFFGKWSHEKFITEGNRFCEKKLPSLLRKSALEKIKYHQSEKHRVVIVTASPKEWIQSWAKEMNIELIATEIEILNNAITGKLSSANCYGIEKVNRISAYLNLDNYTTIYAYGDSAGDKEMLAIAQHPHFKYFKD